MLILFWVLELQTEQLFNKDLLPLPQNHIRNVIYKGSTDKYQTIVLANTTIYIFYKMTIEWFFFLKLIIYT